MPNPRNYVNLCGHISPQGVQILKDRGGTGFAASFTLLVKRNFRDRDGKYGVDPVPVRYPFKSEDGGIASFISSLGAGDGLMVCGTLHVDSCARAIIQYVQAETVSVDDTSRSHKYNRVQEAVNAAFPVRGRPLPL